MSLEGKSLVIGDGGWGEAIALALHRAGRSVAVWGIDPEYTAEVARTRDNYKYLAGIPIPGDLLWTHDVDRALEGVTEVYSVVPTQFIRATLQHFKGRLGGMQIVSASKGLEIETLQRPTEILADVLGSPERLSILSGPSHAEEVGRGMATTVVVAANQAKLAERVQARISSDSFRVYTSSDLVGVELGGALKNIIAIAAGVADGIGLGDNAKAALVSRGLVEMARFGEVCGAHRATFFGLSGAGDLMVTCYSQHSRNRSLGQRIGGGETLEQVLSSTEKVAEGVWTCQAIRRAAHARGVEMPITEALGSILFDECDARQAVTELMTRPTRPELDPA
ncbi:MAG: NAD(P)-dependent glycerol-3-phosphate dehydrogenase [Planctomycetes bacterium]|nr:NAD(P)-dependent glycerol-3-phosphate dehydrogenase [Planctomycetota bacterium]